MKDHGREGGEAVNAQQGQRDAIAAGMLLVAGTTYLTMSFGVAPLLIVGVAGSAAYLLWFVAYRPAPFVSTRLLSLYLATVGGFAFHSIEECLGHYGPAVGRIFGFAWTDSAFLVAILVLLGALSFVAIGLQRRVRLAGFVAILFLMTRLAEVGLFIFPFLRPAIAPDVAQSVSETVHGTMVHDMPNHCMAVVGAYYFPGMLTVVLPLVPAVLALREIWRGRAKPVE
jgi:hypothetical protein